ncbi:MAG: metallophosphoesterase [Kiritimatiellae bacterium]|nr:metallophosphoesterase [Kiritimatiellia bacterium]
MKCGRREFLEMSAGAWLASRLGARADSQLPPLSIKQIRIPVDVTQPFSALHVSDSHLTLVNEDDAGDTRKINLANSRSRIFPNAEYYLGEAVATARARNELLLHTGDLIDFVSYGNLERASQTFAADDWYATSGNHEFSKYVGEATEDAAYKAESYDRVQAAFPNDLTFASRVVNGVNFVAIDDVYYNVTEAQHALFEQEVAKGLPIILLCHVPFYLPGLCAEQLAQDSSAYVTGAPLEVTSQYPSARAAQQRTDQPTADFLAWLKEQPLLKGILCGHLHKYHEERFSPTAMQYVCSGNFQGEVQRITFAADVSTPASGSFPASDASLPGRLDTRWHAAGGTDTESLLDTRFFAEGRTDGESVLDTKTRIGTVLFTR